MSEIDNNMQADKPYGLARQLIALEAENAALRAALELREHVIHETVRIVDVMNIEGGEQMLKEIRAKYDKISENRAREALAKGGA